MHSGAVELGEAQDVGDGVRQAILTLTAAQGRLRLHVADRSPGRAEAIFEGRSWAAKHYWHEGQGVWVYEFDEALPAGQIVVRVPVA
ncbi:MAG TPA: hypothetical protein VEB43_08735 [Anaeromyxobacter sp.]|nr:hypothetical protein [Anaeromyxobacter sp.]